MDGDTDGQIDGQALFGRLYLKKYEDAFKNAVKKTILNDFSPQTRRHIAWQFVTDVICMIINESWPRRIVGRKTHNHSVNLCFGV